MSTPTTHARLSPSAWKRWSICPGSVKLIESLDITHKTNHYAAEGTVAHTVCELALQENKDAAYYIGHKFVQDGYNFTVTESMAEAVQVYVDYVNLIINHSPTSELHLEVKCSLKELDIPGLEGGTSDCVIIDKANKNIYIIDYKHGAGVAVEVEDNGQALQYGLGTVLGLQGKVKGLKDYVITLVIVQPRAHHRDGPIRAIDYYYAELMEWKKYKLIPAAKATLQQNPPLIPHEDACRWCDAKPCSAMQNKINELAIVDFESVVPAKPQVPSVNTLTVEQKINIYKHKDLLDQFVKSVTQQIHEEIEGGSTDYKDHIKLVRGRTQRKFTEYAFDDLESPLLDYLDEDDLYTRKSKNLTQIESALKQRFKALGNKNFVKLAKEVMDEITYKPEAPLTIAPITDGRSTVTKTQTAIEDFSELVI